KIFFSLSLRGPTQSNETIFELSAMKVDRLLLVVIPLLILSGPYVNAGPVGDFFKKVGHSISKPLQSQPPPPPQSARPQPANTPHATRRRTSRAAPTAAATPPAAVGQASHPPKEELTGSTRRVSAEDMEKANAGLPYAITVQGR